jgi:uncharacterized membrane protein HdeD (DUF308 family)
MAIYAYQISFWVVVISGILLAVVGTIAYKGPLELGHTLAGPVFCLAVLFGLSLSVQIWSRFTPSVQEYIHSMQGAVPSARPLF